MHDRPLHGQLELVDLGVDDDLVAVVERGQHLVRGVGRLLGPTPDRGAAVLRSWVKPSMATDIEGLRTLVCPGCGHSSEIVRRVGFEGRPVTERLGPWPPYPCRPPSALAGGRPQSKAGPSRGLPRPSGDRSPAVGDRPCRTSLWRHCSECSTGVAPAVADPTRHRAGRAGVTSALDDRGADSHESATLARPSRPLHRGRGCRRCRVPPEHSATRGVPLDRGRRRRCLAPTVADEAAWRAVASADRSPAAAPARPRQPADLDGPVRTTSPTPAYAYWSATGCWPSGGPGAGRLADSPTPGVPSVARPPGTAIASRPWLGSKA